MTDQSKKGEIFRGSTKAIEVNVVDMNLMLTICPYVVPKESNI